MERTETGRVLVHPSPGMLALARLREHQGAAVKNHFESGRDIMHGFLAEACYHVVLGRAGVEHRWHDDWGLVDITLHNGRTIDVKCRGHMRERWSEPDGISVPAYVVKRRTCDLIAFAGWDGSVMTLVGLLTLAGVEKNGTHLPPGMLYPTTRRPVRYECYEVVGSRIPKLATQLAPLRRGSYARERDPEWWMELWPRTA